MRHALSAVLVWCLATPALATTSRVQALSGNRAFTDDTDVFLFPSVISDVGNAVNMNFSNSGAVDGGVVWDKERMLWLQRANPASPSGEAPYMLTYGQGDGDTGWLARGAWSEEEIKLGGAWSNGGQGRKTSNFTVGGDIITATGDTEQYAVSTYVAKRDLKKKSHLVWDARADIVPDVSNTVTGSLATGPRWKTDRVRAALSIGPGVELVNSEDGNGTKLDMPATNIAAEYAVRDWLLVRGSATAALRLAVADVSEFSDSREFEMASGGMLGVGIKHEDTAVFDMAVSPPWLTNGPALLSGTTTPMFLTVSGRMML